MFVLDKEEETGREFWWPVTVKKPVDGGYKSHQFQIRFKMLPQRRIDDLLEGLGAPAEEEDDGEADAPQDRIDNALLHEVIKGWKDIYVMKGDERAEAPFDGDTLDRFLDIPYWRSAVVQAYFKILAGTAERTKRRRKNS